MMQYNWGQGEKANWLIAETAFDPTAQGKCEAIFCVGNGYLGQRAALEENYAFQTRDLLVNGTFNKFDADEVTELPNLPDVTHMEFILCGERFSMDAGKVEGYLRTLDLQTGEVCRTLTWESPMGHRYALRFTRFASLHNEHLLGQKVEITPLGGDASLRLDSGIDGRMTNDGSQHFHQGDMRVFGNRILRMTSVTTQSAVTCCLHAAHSFRLGDAQAETKLLPVINRRLMLIRAETNIPQDQTLVIEKLTAVTTSRDLAYVDCENAAELAVADGRAQIEAAMAAGYDALFAESQRRWAALWQAQDVQIASDSGYDQLLVRFALYHLNIMGKKDDPRMGIGAKGLSGEGYKGHSFWDTEIFLLPYFTLTQPAAARKLLEYRYNSLVGARRKAAEYGYEGAMYPWESAWVDDGEVTPVLWDVADIETGEPITILTGLIEQHITADVAFGVWQYYAATGDQDFMDRCGYEILIDTARFWASRCTWDEQRNAYVICDVIGPDEYKEHVDNNAYTNYMAANNLDLGMRCIDALTARGGEAYERLAAQFDLPACRAKMADVRAKLYLPQPDGEGIVPQFEGYFDLEYIDLAPFKTGSVGAICNSYNLTQISRLQVHKQADTLVLMLLMDDLFTPEVKARNYAFYEARTLHDSSLSKSTHCVLAADLHESETAYRFFTGCGDIDLGPGMHTSDAGIHTASMGGIWQCAVYGFGGARIVGDALHIHPRLPEAWHTLAFPLVWHGQPLRVQATKASVRVTNEGQEAVRIVLAGSEIALNAGESVETVL